MIRRIAIVVALTLLCTTLVLAGNEHRIIPPPGVFYYQSAATVYGSESAWINPAGLGRSSFGGFQLMADYENGKYGKSWGGVIYRSRMTTAFRHLHNPSGTDFSEWIGAAGLGFGTGFNLGISYRHFREAPGEYNERHYWNLGLIHLGHGPLAFGAVWSNLNRGRIKGERSAVEQRYAVGYRPFGKKLTLSVDMFLSTQNKISEADYIYQAEYTVVPGLFVNGYVDSEHGFQFGFRANLLKYFVGSRSSFERGGHSGRTTAFIGASNRRQTSLIAQTHRRLNLAISGGVPENPPNPIFGKHTTPFVTLVGQIYRAADDPSISEMLLKLNRVSMGLGQTQELREAIRYFKARGKRVTCHLSAPNNIGYYLGSIADTILIPPVSQFNLVGLRAELTFWASTLEKLGARLELMRIGEYKTAPESYTRSSSSDEYKAQINYLLDELYDQFVADIAYARGLTVDSVRTLIDHGPLTSVEATESGLVDGLSYADNLRDNVLRRMPEISFRSYLQDSLITDDWTSPPALAVVVAEGEITGSQGSDSPFSSSGGIQPGSMSRALAQARSNKDVRGIVLRVNSPGGQALAGEEIHHKIEETAKKLPLVVSMSNVAASGGYYISLAGKRTFVSPATVTGSIGIYGGKLDLSGLFDKLEVGKELYTRGKFAGMLSMARPFTDEERTKYFSHLQAFYDHFLQLTAESRQLSVDSVDNLARGRVWSGQDAVACGLADETGGLKQSLDYLAGLAGLDNYTVEVYPRKRPLFLLPANPLWRSLGGLIFGNSEEAEQAGQLLSDSEDAAIMARLPFNLVIE